VRRAKQQIDAEWKAEVSRKLEELSELRGLRKDVQRIVVALEKLAGIESQDSDEGQISWPESEREVRGTGGVRKKENRGRGD